MVIFIHNLACNQQMSINDDEQYTERSITAMFIHNLVRKQINKPTMNNSKFTNVISALTLTKHKLKSHKASYL